MVRIGSLPLRIRPSRTTGSSPPQPPARITDDHARRLPIVASVTHCIRSWGKVAPPADPRRAAQPPDQSPRPSGKQSAGVLVSQRFRAALVGQTATALTELSANFHDETAQGTAAYAETMLKLYPELDSDILANDAIAAIAAFTSELKIGC